MANIISSINIDLSDMSANASSRQLKVIGDTNSEFNLQVFNNSGSFYNFTTQAFASGFTPKNNLKIKLQGGVHTSTILFPATSGATYTIFLYTIPDSSDTEFSSATGSGGKTVFKKTITQVNNATITLAPTNGGSAMKTMPSTTSTGSSIQGLNVPISINWDIENVETDANGFGLRLTRQPTDTDWYFQTTETADGAVASSSNQLVVDDLTDLAVGMELTYITGTTAPGAATTITAIDNATKTLTLSRNQAITDGHTMTFRATGSNIIQRAIGARFDFSGFTATSASLFKTVRSTSSSNDITLNGTYGIAGGGHVTISGVNIVNTSTNTVQSVSASSSAGGVTMQVAQVVKAGSRVYFTGSTQKITINGTVLVEQYPSSNRTINLNLDNFITAGAAS